MSTSVGPATPQPPVTKPSCCESFTSNLSNHKWELLGSGSVAGVAAAAAINGGILTNPMGWTIAAAALAVMALLYFVFKLLATEENNSQPITRHVTSVTTGPAATTAAAKGSAPAQPASTGTTADPAEPAVADADPAEPAATGTTADPAEPAAADADPAEPAANADANPADPEPAPAEQAQPQVIAAAGNPNQVHWATQKFNAAVAKAHALFQAVEAKASATWENPKDHLRTAIGAGVTLALVGMAATSYYLSARQ